MSLLLIYERRGGLARFDDQLIIDAAHQAILVRPTERVMLLLDPLTVDSLRQQLAKAKFGQLAAEYSLPNGHCDHVEYTLTYQNHVVRATDIAVPKILQPVLDQLNQIVERKIR